MIDIISLLGTLGILSILLLFYILAKLSERFGSVIKMPAIYRYYYVASGLVVVSFVTQLVATRTELTSLFNPNGLSVWWFLLLAYYLPQSIGLTISLVVTWRYWSWLITERSG